MSRSASSFLVVGERTNITGSPKFAKAIKAGQHPDINEIKKRCDALQEYMESCELKAELARRDSEIDELKKKLAKSDDRAKELWANHLEQNRELKRLRCG